MKKTIKATAIVLIGLMIWSVLVYIGVSFLNAETNPFMWSKSARGGMLFVIFCYICFTPLMIFSLKDEM